MKTHGDATGGKTAEYRTWMNMKNRCVPVDPSRFNWKFYGGKGIRVCDRWLHSFENFLTDMGRRPSDKHSIDRIDSSKDYSPKNCRWATIGEQRRNYSRNINLTHCGKTMCAMDWSVETGIKEATIRARLRRGMSDKEALTAPLILLGRHIKK